MVAQGPFSSLLIVLLNIVFLWQNDNYKFGIKFVKSKYFFIQGEIFLKMYLKRKLFIFFKSKCLL